MTLEGSVLVLAWIVMLLLTLATVGLAHRVARLEGVIQQLTRTDSDVRQLLSQVPEFGGLHWNDSPRTLLLLISQECETCRSVLAALRDVAEETADPGLRLVIVLSHEWSLPAEVQLPQDSRVVVDRNAFMHLGVRATPFVAIVDETGRLRSASVVRSADGLHSTIRRSDQQLSPALAHDDGGQMNATDQ